MATIKGQIAKMAVALGAAGQAQYEMVLGDARLAMQPLIGQAIRLSHAGEINCLYCDRRIKKSYSGGFCFPCSQKLPQCDLCIMKPETCHYAAGTCRDPKWGEAHCLQDHIVYLANSSGLKVGITRATQVPTRWIDQGATAALPIFSVAERYQSGVIEMIFKAHVADRTDWRKMLKGVPVAYDLRIERDRLMALCQDEITAAQNRFGESAIVALDESVVNIDYPVETYPSKVTSLNFDKTPDISGVLQGIKGQYLLLDTGVLNIRKFSGYQIEVNTDV